jgi:hypothetical protein
VPWQTKAWAPPTLETTDIADRTQPIITGPQVLAPAADVTSAGGCVTAALTEQLEDHMFTLIKAVVAAATAATTLGFAGAAAGVLPGLDEPQSTPSGTASVTVQAPGPSGSAGSTEASATITPSGFQAEAGANATSPAAALPAVPLPAASPVPGLPALPADIRACLPDCLDSVLEVVPALPVDVRECVSAAVGFATSATAGGVPDPTSLDLAACGAPDVSACISDVRALASGLGSLPSIPGLGNIPFGSALGGGSGGIGLPIGGAGLPIAGLPAGLDLSGCLPTGALGS